MSFGSSAGVGLLVFISYACLTAMVYRQIQSLEGSIGFEAVRKRLARSGTGLDVRLPPAQLPPCPHPPPGLVGQEFTIDEWNELDSRPLHLADVRVDRGGSWAPDHCAPREHLAVLIPYKNRHRNLMTLTTYLHPFLQRQLRNYTVFVAEQIGRAFGMKFNKGRVMNAAILKIMETNPSTDCIIMQDNDKNLYECSRGSENPRHLSPAVDEFDFEQPYDYLIGGSLAMKPAVYQAVNGFSNSFWGWGGEDDDLFYRFNRSGRVIERPDLLTGRFWALPHKKRKPINSYLTFSHLHLLGLGRGGRRPPLPLQPLGEGHRAARPPHRALLGPAAQEAQALHLLGLGRGGAPTSRSPISAPCALVI